MMLKNIIIKSDRFFTGGIILSTYSKYIQHKLAIRLRNAHDYRYIVHYQKNKGCLLANLCEKYGSDKGAVKMDEHPYPWPPHTYSDVYAALYDHCRMSVQKVFECGLGTNNPNLDSSMGENGKPGASLRVWRDYFPNAKIFGADIDREILFKENRIDTLYVDQTDPKSINKFWEETGVDGFDLMIDDGLHTYEAGVCLFEHSISRLANNGIYIIEDVYLHDMNRFVEYFRGKPYSVNFINLVRPNVALWDNSMVVIRKTSLD